MDDLTDDEQIVFDDMVRRNLMEMYAKEKAAELFQAKKRKQHEEEIEKKLKQDQQSAERLTNSLNEKIKQTIQLLKERKENNPTTYQEYLNKEKASLVNDTKFINRYRKIYQLPEIDFNLSIYDTI